VAQDRYVSDAASNEIKAGEEEHLTDLEWARHLAYDQVADAVKPRGRIRSSDGNFS
jgi:hypothetical protein